ncbi:MAG: aminodeoxychorismate synthase component I [Bacteroidales bacterium]|nr:aminodeoxychorismate synthase component I [Bacteroidales bacterium]
MDDFPQFFPVGGKYSPVFYFQAPIVYFYSQFQHCNILLTKNEAIALFNSWGRQRIPFLFVIDYEMIAVRMYRLDHPAGNIPRFEFQHNKSGRVKKHLINNDFTFKKFPVPFHLYESAFVRVQQQIRAGNSYLTNLTFPTPVETNLSFTDIYNRSEAPYKLLVDGEFVCFSPESFVTITNGVIATFPMKGTIKASEMNAAETILSDPKEKAEHNTIVDLLRNDLSRVSREVTVKRFRYIDKICTHEGEMLQVSSEICGLLPPDYHTRLGDILFSMLPAGSITGAPKPLTLQLIRDVEGINRNYYTGICGVFDGNNLDSAVMIRYIEMHEGKMRFRSGGGITFMSHAENEYRELIDKVYVPIV